MSTSLDKVLGEAARLTDEYSGGHVEAASVAVSPQGIRTTQRPSASVEAKNDTIDLHGTTLPNLEIKQERSQHQIMVYLKAQGYTNREISKATGYTDAWVSQITRQPWFKERLIATIREAGMDPVKAFLSAEALPSLEALATIRDNAELPAAARVAAANAVLDRAFGKPTQHIQSESTVNVKNAKSTVTQIESELASIDEQLKSRGQRGVN